MKTLLVTGANGFIGRHLCAELEKRGWLIRKAVRSTSALFYDDSNVAVVGSVDANTDWSAALKGCETVIHTAGLAHVNCKGKDEALAKYRTINRDGVIRLARCASAAGIKRFLFLSSVGVYGELDGKRPASESTACAPELPYSVSKREAEIALYHELQSSSMECVIVRPPLVYGPGCPGNFRKLTKLVATGVPLPLGNINSQRNMIGITNLVDFLIRVAEYDEPVAGIYNIADTETVSLQELFRLIGGGLERRVKLVRFPESIVRLVFNLFGKAEIFKKLRASACIDSSLARETFQWRQPIRAAEGIQEAAASFRIIKD